MHVESDSAADTPQRTDDSSAEPSHGTLILLGGGCVPADRAFGAFLTASDALDDGRIVVITSASSDPAAAAAYYREMFATLGAPNVLIPPFQRDDAALDDEVADMIAGGDGVFLAGGDQVALVAALRSTRTCAALHQLYARGKVIAGTSAGAVALGETIMAGGEIDSDGNLVEQYMGPGLGLLGYDAIIDTHFSERRRLRRLFLAVAENTRLFGIGIDENTGIVVRDGLGEVIGAGGVTFVDGRDTVRFDNAHELQKGRQLTLSHLRVGIIGTHYRLNFAARELHELTLVRDPRTEEPAEPSV